MANSKYEYVRQFERDEILLPNTWIVIRIDGRGFHKLATHYSFTKPNDLRALALMNAAATALLASTPDLCIAYGLSDEYSFVFHRTSTLFERRSAKLLSTVVSTFTASYIHLWPQHFPATPLSPAWLPNFDARCVCYPSVGNLRDYLAWRQVDCHINNLYNTVFWALVERGGMGHKEAEEALKGTVAGEKNEILWGRFGVNYNEEEEVCRKGSVVFRDFELGSGTGEGTSEVGEGVQVSKTQVENHKAKAQIVVRHVDIIKDEFWEKKPWILSGKAGKPVINSTE